MMLTVTLVPRHNLLTSVDHLQRTLPNLQQEEIGESNVISLKFREALFELALPPLIWLVGELCVQENVNKAFRGECAGCPRDKRSAICWAVEMALKLIGVASDPLGERITL